jgi:hypothetical protein
MKGSKINSSIALILIVLLSAGLFAWIAYTEDGAVAETVDVGTDGIQKAREIKDLLEERQPFE